jgi:CRP-like cAMP-binding protein
VPADASDLTAVPLFAPLSETELAEMAGFFEVKLVGSGVRLVGEGATGYSFFVVRDGELAVTADGKEVASLGPGDFFGEMALLGSGRRKATVTTTSPACVLVLFGTDFRLLQEHHPGIARQIEDAMLKRLEQLQSSSAA